MPGAVAGVVTVMTATCPLFSRSWEIVAAKPSPWPGPPDGCTATDRVVERAPRPVAAPGEALVQVEAAAITPTELSWDETYVDASGRPRTPTIPSHEVAGHVIAIGQGVDDLSVGESVFGLVDFDRNGAAAEFVSVPARALAPAPRTVVALTAAAVPLAGLSAWQVRRGASKSGTRVGPGEEQPS